MPQWWGEEENTDSNKMKFPDKGIQSQDSMLTVFMLISEVSSLSASVLTPRAEVLSSWSILLLTNTWGKEMYISVYDEPHFGS